MCYQVTKRHEETLAAHCEVKEANWKGYKLWDFNYVTFGQSRAMEIDQ